MGRIGHPGAIGNKMVKCAGVMFEDRATRKKWTYRKYDAYSEAWPEMDIWTVQVIVPSRSRNRDIPTWGPQTPVREQDVPDDVRAYALAQLVRLRLRGEAVTWSPRRAGHHLPGRGQGTQLGTLEAVRHIGGPGILRVVRAHIQRSTPGAGRPGRGGVELRHGRWPTAGLRPLQEEAGGMTWDLRAWNFRELTIRALVVAKGHTPLDDPQGGWVMCAACDGNWFIRKRADMADNPRWTGVMAWDEPLVFPPCSKL